MTAAKAARNLCLVLALTVLFHTPNHGQREEEMDTMQAFAMAQLNAGNEPMVFDWDEAARRIVKAGARTASAGLSVRWLV